MKRFSIMDYIDYSEKKLLLLILKNQFKMAKTQAEVAQELRDMKAQNEKSREEVLAKIATLEQAVKDAGNATPEVEEAIADLKSSIQADDDLNPDTTGGEEEPV